MSIQRGLTVATVLAPWSQGRPATTALVDRGHRLTYAALDAQVATVARGLVGRGVRAGDRVAVSLPNSASAVMMFLAVARAGGVFVGVHPGLAPAEKAALLVDATPHLVITTPECLADVPTGGRTLAVAPTTAGLEAIGSPVGDLPVVSGSDLLAIAYTSGTTGRPKGVVHNHANALLPAEVILYDRMGGRGECIGTLLPLTTLNVLIVGPLLALLGGGTSVCLETSDPIELVARIRREGIEHLSCSPATVHDLLHAESVDPTDLAGLRLGVGGAACPEPLRHAYRAKVGGDFTTGYGLSEAPAAVAQETDLVPHRRGASGKAMAHVRIVALDDNDEPLPAGRRGQLAVAPSTTGPFARRWSGMEGYWGDPELTAAMRREGYLLTGDEGHVDADGYVFVAGRRSEVINRGGSKVSPSEVGDVLRSHPEVSDCIVIGIADPRLGEVVGAVVESSSDLSASALRAHCATALARYKIPSVLAVRESLPRNAMGKVDRASVRQLLGEGASAEPRADATSSEPPDRDRR